MPGAEGQGDESKNAAKATEPSAQGSSESKAPSPPQARQSRAKASKGRAARAQQKRGSRIEWLFPRASLSTAIEVAQVLKDKNGGNPWPPDDVASAMNRSAATGSFFYAASAAKQYGLTTGGRDATEIGLAPLGRELMYAGDSSTEHSLKVQAFFTVDVFKRVYAHYHGAELPEMRYLGNTLKGTFGMDPATHEEFVKLYKENCEFLGLRGEVPAGVADGKIVRVRVRETGKGLTAALGEPTDGKPLTCFVVMPFTERSAEHKNGFFSEVLNELIKPAAEAAGFRVTTAHRQGSDVIQSTIVNDLLDADLVVVDLTEHNPNAMLELGMRLHAEKPIALIRAQGTGPIFDVDNMLRVAEYDPRMWPTTVKSDLQKIEDHIRGAWELRDEETFLSILRTRPGRNGQSTVARTTPAIH
jgi:hypothetical protein